MAIIMFIAPVFFNLIFNYEVNWKCVVFVQWSWVLAEIDQRGIEKVVNEEEIANVIQLYELVKSGKATDADITESNELKNYRRT